MKNYIGQNKVKDSMHTIQEKLKHVDTPIRIVPGATLGLIITAFLLFYEYSKSSDPFFQITKGKYWSPWKMLLYHETNKTAEKMKTFAMNSELDPVYAAPGFFVYLLFILYPLANRIEVARYFYFALSVFSGISSALVSYSLMSIWNELSLASALITFLNGGLASLCWKDINQMNELKRKQKSG